MVITRYNESLVDPRAVNLTNSIGTVDIEVPVGFSYPTGSFRLSEPNNIEFTHFSASIPSAGGTRFFKITNLTCINSKVTEYYYDLDYLKDYWMRCSGGSPTLSLPNTLEGAYYCDDEIATLSKTIHQVNQYPSKIVSNTELKTGDAVNVSRLFFIMYYSENTDNSARISVKNPSNEAITTQTVYTFDTGENLAEFFLYLMKVDPNSDTTFTTFYSSITNCFYAPCTITDTGITKHVVDNIQYVGVDGNMKMWNYDTTAIAGKVAWLELPNRNSIVENVRGTNIKITINNANDLAPYKKYNLYIPYLGWYEVPLAELVESNTAGLGTEVELIVKYYYDLLNGMVAARIGIRNASFQEDIWSSFQTPFESLPQVTLPTSDYASNAIKNNQQVGFSLLSNSIGLLGNIANFNISGAIGNVGSAIVNVLQHQANEKNLQDFGSSLTMGQGVTTGQLDRQFKLVVTTYDTSLTYAQAAELNGFPVLKYRDSIMLRSNALCKMWIDTTNSKFRGPEWYVNRVKQEFNKDYITYALSS